MRKGGKVKDNLVFKEDGISMQTLKRLPGYYNYLCGLQQSGVLFVSSPSIANELGLNEVQVRKDLAAVSHSPGKPRKGFEVEPLIQSIAECLGYHNSEDAILVGAGRLGKALLAYEGFKEHGVRIVAAFDSNSDALGKKVFPMSKLPSLCHRMNIHLAIIAVPAGQAQAVCDLLVDNGILAIWNFAPVHLRVPKEILVQNENLATQLALLARSLANRLAGEEAFK